MLLSNANRKYIAAFSLVLVALIFVPAASHGAANSSTVLAAAEPAAGGNSGSTGQPALGGNQTPQSQSSGQTIANPLKFDSLETLLDAILAAAISLGSVILTLALIYTGFLFVAARGNEESISKAKKALLYTIIGGLILLGATAIKTVITDTVSTFSS